jgi:hypothetical protein
MNRLGFPCGQFKEHFFSEPERGGNQIGRKLLNSGVEFGCGRVEEAAGSGNFVFNVAETGFFEELS